MATQVRRGAIPLALILLTSLATLAVPAFAQTANQMHADVVLPGVRSIDVERGTATLPLHRGTSHGKTVWYIVTDASNAAAAKAQGAIYAPLIAQLDGAAVQTATKRGAELSFAGAPDFSKTRLYTPGDTGFPPKAAAPGAVADNGYSPFVRIAGSSVIYNAPIVAAGNGPFDVTTHTNTADRVLSIDTAKGDPTVTILLSRGFFDGKRVLYLSTEASDRGAAAVERAVYVPRLAKAKAGISPIFVVANGQHGKENAQAQGLQYLALDTALGADATTANLSRLGSPFNVLATFPTADGTGIGAAYSPLWDVNVGTWGAQAKPTLLTSAAQFNATLKPAHPGFVVNCPAVAVLR